MDGFHVGDMRFGHGVDALSNFPSTGMASNSVSSGMAISQYASSGWDPLLCPSQDRHFTNPPFIPVFPMSTTHQIIKEDEGSRCNFPSLFGHNPPVAFIEQVPEISCSDGRRFPEMLGYFGLPETPITTNFGSADMEGDVNEGTSVNNGPSQDCQISEEDVVRSSRSGSRRKRARVSNSPYVCMDDQVDLKRNPSVSTFDVPKEHEEKKQKIGQTPCSNSHDKQNGKQTEENASSAEASKENYIHVRARRGQATNSHSLAERVRREKISERMRMLQELVPGCNKITGKAVMLDEIINYVQSLQQQVEFLSMKLATVSPELDIDLERILSKEILLSQGNSATMHGIGHGMVSSHPHTQGNFQEAFPGLPSSHQQYPPLTQAFPEIELQTAFQVGFDSTSAFDGSGRSGHLKLEMQNSRGGSTITRL